MPFTRLSEVLHNLPTLAGIFFIIPCIDTYSKVDLRTVSFDVPPQEVRPDLIYSDSRRSQRA